MTHQETVEASNSLQENNYLLGMVLFSLLNYFDFVTTKIGLDGNATELNPLLALAENDLQLLGIKTTLVLATIFASTIVIKKTGDKEIVDMAYKILNVFFALVVLSNLYQIWGR